jgi:ribosome recycling factor
VKDIKAFTILSMVVVLGLECNSRGKAAIHTGGTAMIDDLMVDMRSRMDQSIVAFQNNLDTIRTGRASTTLVERIPVDFYGVKTPMVQVASLSIPDAQSILIRPYNPDDLAAIEKAIALSDLGINPQNDGKALRLQIPPLTEERRRELTKVVGARAEEGRVAIRNIRRDSVSDMREWQGEGEITEDDLRDGQRQVDEITKEYVGKVDAMALVKEEEIMTI